VPVYLFTYHAYRSWNADHPRGFVQKGEGVRPPNERLARAYDEAASFPPFEFDHDTQRFLIDVVRDVCGRRPWQLHAAATEPTHLHALISWSVGDRWPAVRGKVKNIMSLELSKRAGVYGRRWISEDASRKRVRDGKHFAHHMTTYLPKHGGWRWFEDDRGFVAPRGVEPPASAGG